MSAFFNFRHNRRKILQSKQIHDWNFKIKIKSSSGRHFQWRLSSECQRRILLKKRIMLFSLGKSKVASAASLVSRSRPSTSTVSFFIFHADLCKLRVYPLEIRSRSFQRVFKNGMKTFQGSTRAILFKT